MLLVCLGFLLFDVIMKAKLIILMGTQEGKEAAKNCNIVFFLPQQVSRQVLCIWHPHIILRAHG